MAIYKITSTCFIIVKRKFLFLKSGVRGAAPADFYHSGRPKLGFRVSGDPHSLGLPPQFGTCSEVSGVVPHLGLGNFQGGPALSRSSLPRGMDGRFRRELNTMLGECEREGPEGGEATSKERQPGEVGRGSSPEGLSQNTA